MADPTNNSARSSGEASEQSLQSEPFHTAGADHAPSSGAKDSSEATPSPTIGAGDGELRKAIFREVDTFINAPDAGDECTREQYEQGIYGLVDRILAALGNKGEA